MEVSGDVKIASFSVEFFVCGHHVYKTILSSALGEELRCHHEVGNIHDLYAVSVIKPGTGVAGHIPRRISTPFNMFIRSGGSTTCICSYRQPSLFCRSSPRMMRSSLSVTIQG